MNYSKYFNSFLIIKLDLVIWDLFLITSFAASCAKEFTLHGIFIFCKILIISLEPQAYPILIPGKPNDLVKDLKIKRLSYFFTYDITDSLESGTNSIKHSSMKTKVFNFFALRIIDSNSFFDNNSPVGLLGLHKKIHPFFGICEINESNILQIDLLI